MKFYERKISNNKLFFHNFKKLFSLFTHKKYNPAIQCLRLNRSKVFHRLSIFRIWRKRIERIYEYCGKVENRMPSQTWCWLVGITEYIRVKHEPDFSRRFSRVFSIFPRHSDILFEIFFTSLSLFSFNKKK